MIATKEHVKRIAYLQGRPAYAERTVFRPTVEYLLTRPYRTDPAFWQEGVEEHIRDDAHLLWYQKTDDSSSALPLIRWLEQWKTYTFRSVDPDFNARYLPYGFQYPAFSAEQAYSIMRMLLDPYMDISHLAMEKEAKSAHPMDFRIRIPGATVDFTVNRDISRFFLDFYLFHSFLLGLEPVWENDVFEATSFPAYSHRLPDPVAPPAGGIPLL